MFKATRILAMRPTRTMMMRQSPQMFVRQSLALRSPVPKEEQGAHTISQRLRQLKNIPTEIWPLLFVLGLAVGAAFYSLIHKLMVDRTLRLKRQGKID